MARKKFDIQGLIVGQILDALNNEIERAENDPNYKPSLPWVKPWKGGYSGMPKSLSTKKPYRGFNVLYLSFVANEKGYNSPYWLTFNQAGKLGGKIKATERKNSSIVTLWKPFEVKDDEGNVTYRKWMLRYFRVYNLDQAEGIDENKLPQDATAEGVNPLESFSPIEACEKIINEMPNKPKYIIGKIQRACYSPTTDTINMPEPLSFVGEAEYYSTFFHELGHSTGHKKRLNRKTLTKMAAFGSDDYGEDEMVAEMTAAILCGITGTVSTVMENTLAYLMNWRKSISADMGIVLRASTNATKSADCILGKLKMSTK